MPCRSISTRSFQRIIWPPSPSKAAITPPPPCWAVAVRNRPSGVSAIITIALSHRRFRHTTWQFFRLCPGEDDDCPRCMLEHPRDDRLEGKRRRVSTAVVQRFCKPKVGGSIPSPGTIAQGEARHGHAVTAAPQDTGQAHSQAIILRANTSRVGVARRRRMRIADQHPA